MTVNANSTCGAAAALLMPANATAAVLAQNGTPEAAAATTAASVFLAVLAGMTAETPAAATTLPQGATREDAEAPTVDPSDAPLDAATQALIAALTPLAATPPPAATATKPATTDSTATDTVIPGASTPSSSAAGSAPVVQLTDATRAAVAAEQQPVTERSVPDPARSALIAVALDAALPGEHSDADDLTATVSGAAVPAGAAATTTSTATPAAGSGLVFNPLQLVSQLGRSVAQASGGGDQAQPPLQHPVGGARWAEELGSRLTLMAGQGQQSGSLRLTPEHLGPLEVRIDIKDDVANVFFGSQHADTRSALNEAMPRLRELFAASGLLLGDTGVSRDTPRQDTRAAEPQRYGAQSQETSQIDTGMQVSTATRHAGLLDTYA
ncbi:MAG: flagellar hook-length control protein FliK [Pseudomonadota bacterium]